MTGSDKQIESTLTLRAGDPEATNDSEVGRIRRGTATAAAAAMIHGEAAQETEAHRTDNAAARKDGSLRETWPFLDSSAASVPDTHATKMIFLKRRLPNQR